MNAMLLPVALFLATICTSANGAIILSSANLNKYCTMDSTYVHCSSKFIDLVDVNAFNDLSVSGLNDIDLSTNLILSIDPLLFARHPALLQLDLSSNQLGVLDPATLRNLSQLVLLNLGTNRLSYLTPGTFDSQRKLQTLDLSYNRLSSLKTPGIFTPLMALQKLKIRNNRLNELGMDTFKGLANLQYLDLSANKIYELNDSIFSDLVNLKELDFSGNGLLAITAPLFAPLSNIFSLDLSNNALANLEPGTFKSLRVPLDALYLRSNRLAKIDVPDLYCLNLDKISLCNNPLDLSYCDSFGSLKANWENTTGIKPSDCQ
jgi:Leucine-rich repeat (LRR) protein